MPFAFPPLFLILLFLAQSIPVFAQDSPLLPETVAQIGHSGAITALSCSKDKRFLLTGSEDNTAKLWNAHNYDLLTTLNGHTDRVSSVALSVDGNYAVTGSRDKTVCVWNTNTGTIQKQFLGHRRGVNAVAVSPNEEYLISGSEDSTLIVWDMKSGERLFTLKGHNGPVNTVSVTADNGYAISGSKDGTAKIWELANGKLFRTLQGHEGEIYAAITDSSSRYIVTGGRDRTIKLWDLNSGMCLKTLIGHSSWVSSVSFSSDGSYAASVGGDNSLIWWNLHKGEAVFRIKASEQALYAVAVAANGKSIAVAGKDKSVSIWDINENKTPQKPTHQIVAAAEAPMLLAASASDESILLMANHEHTVQVWHGYKGKLLATLDAHQDNITAIAISADGKTAMTAAQDQQILLWEIPEGKIIRKIINPIPVTVAAFSANAQYIATNGKDSTVIVWNAKTGKQQSVLKKERSAVTALSISPDGQTIAVASENGDLSIWQCNSGRLLQRLDKGNKTIHALLIYKDALYAGTADGTVFCREIETGKLLHTYRGHTKRITSIAVNAYTNWVVSSSIDHTAIIFDIDKQDIVRVLNEQHPTPILSVAWISNGRCAITASTDGQVRFWHYFTGELLATITTFNPNEWLITTPQNGYDCTQKACDKVRVVFAKRFEWNNLADLKRAGTLRMQIENAK